MVILVKVLAQKGHLWRGSDVWDFLENGRKKKSIYYILVNGNIYIYL